MPLLDVVNPQPMFQVCTQAVDQVMGFLIFKFCIPASNLLYHSHKPHLMLPVPITAPFSWNFHY